MSTPSLPAPGGPDVLLVGAGAVAVAHARAMTHLGARPVVVGRGGASAEAFREQTGLPVLTGGLGPYLDREHRLPERAVVAVPVLDLAAVTTGLVRAGVRDLLVEKPVGVDEEEIAAVAEAAAGTGARVYAAYNRRFHVATAQARRLIAEDGGLRSMAFDFTERAHVVEASPSPAALKEAWLLANSSHVIDLAFHLAGEPVEWHAQRAGSLPWHRRGAVFAGSGRSAGGALFSYRADWGGPGGWGVELVTAHRSLLLRPLERLQVADRQHPEHVLHDADYRPDLEFKPGFLEQMRSFLGDRRHLLDVHGHLRQVRRVVVPIREGTVAALGSS